MGCGSQEVFVKIDAGGGDDVADREASQGNRLISVYLFLENTPIFTGPSSKRCEIILIRLAVELSIGLVMRVGESSCCLCGDIGTLIPEVFCPKAGRRKHSLKEFKIGAFGSEKSQSGVEEVAVLFVGITLPRPLRVFTFLQL
jgi:hypothetical protein